MSTYYNDNDRYVGTWTRNLIVDGALPTGIVDERSIEEVSPDDLRPHTQVHLFSGIGGWAYALKLAGWPDDRPVWTVSCPCQPLSVAGKGEGDSDRRHLWPVVASLIAECRPPIIFGEQVASSLGREWVSGVRLDLESLGYACGIACLPAAGVGAPHIRSRLWWVAVSERSGTGWQGYEAVAGSDGADDGLPRQDGSPNRGLGNTPATGRQGRSPQPRERASQRPPEPSGAPLGVRDSASGGRRQGSALAGRRVAGSGTEEREQRSRNDGGTGSAGGVSDSGRSQRERRRDAGGRDLDGEAAGREPGARNGLASSDRETHSPRRPPCWCLDGRPRRRS